MLRLYTMRHAKSSWAVPGAKDFDRELNDRGLSDLENISRELLSREYNPEVILCSPAERTRQTLDGIQSAFSDHVEIVFDKSLYASDVRSYMEILQNLGAVSSVLIIGHNPMCGSLVSGLVGDGSKSDIAKIAYRYPTATVSVLDFDITDWNQLKAGTGTLVDCLLAKEFRK